MTDKDLIFSGHELFEYSLLLCCVVGRPKRQAEILPRFERVFRSEYWRQACLLRGILKHFICYVAENAKKNFNPTSVLLSPLFPDLYRGLPSLMSLLYLLIVLLLLLSHHRVLLSFRPHKIDRIKPFSTASCLRK